MSLSPSPFGQASLTHMDKQVPLQKGQRHAVGRGDWRARAHGASTSMAKYEHLNFHFDA